MHGVNNKNSVVLSSVAAAMDPSFTLSEFKGL